MLLKNFFLLLNVLILLVFQALFEGGINVTQSMPEKVNPGSDFVVEVTINKGDISGFAKYSQELPDGFTASVIDASGGNFTFAEKNLKIIWMSLPTEKEFKIKYKINVDANVNGSFPLSAKLSYLENNEKKTYDVPAFNLTVGEGGQEPTPAPSASEPPAPQAQTQPQEARTANASQSGALTASRVAPANATGEFTVEITVNRGSITGFAKLEEIIPSGFTATGLETNGSVFSFVDGKAKFLWMNMPSNESFKVSYKIKPPADFKGACTVEGTFSYVENEETKKAIVSPTTTNIGSEEAAPIAQASAQPQESPQPAEENAPKPAAKAPKSGKTTSVNKVSPNAGKGIIFRVQVCAVHKNVPNTYFNDLFKIQDEIYSETHEGWFKYTTGSYNEYRAARDRRVDLAANGVNTGPFVTSYNNGNRITVQEALMITRQKWVQ